MVNKERKVQYFAKLTELLDTHTSCFIVHADHVRSKQFADVRAALRGKATIAMGKNTLMRKCMSQWLETHKDSKMSMVMEKLRGNVGVVFLKAGAKEVKDIITKFTVPAPARAGIEANCDVTVPPGPTGCDPSQTSYFQALNVPTKIVKGQIEITSDVPLVKKGERVTPGAASLLQKLNIKPFTFGLVIQWVYENGSMFAAEVLDFTEDMIKEKFSAGVRNVAAASLELGHANLASIPHSLSNAAKWCTAVIVGSESSYSFEKAEQILAYLKDPSAFAATTSGGDAKEEEKKEEEEEEEEEEVAMGNLMGGGDDDGW